MQIFILLKFFILGHLHQRHVVVYFQQFPNYLLLNLVSILSFYEHIIAICRQSYLKEISK